MHLLLFGLMFCFCFFFLYTFFYSLNICLFYPFSKPAYDFFFDHCFVGKLKFGSFSGLSEKSKKNLEIELRLYSKSLLLQPFTDCRIIIKLRYPHVWVNDPLNLKSYLQLNILLVIIQSIQFKKTFLIPKWN